MSENFFHVNNVISSFSETINSCSILRLESDLIFILLKRSGLNSQTWRSEVVTSKNHLLILYNGNFSLYFIPTVDSGWGELHDEFQDGPHKSVLFFLF